METDILYWITFYENSQLHYVTKEMEFEELPEF
jgi:hypothetical protein